MAVYLVDVGVYKPPEELRVKISDVKDDWVDAFMANGATAEEAVDNVMFQSRVFDKSGLSKDGTYLPKSINPCYCGNKPITDMDTAAKECSTAVGGAIDNVLVKTGLEPSDIDYLITCCSIYCPTPSMASMVVNKYKMKSSIQSYHLGGMGCSMGVVAINLVRDVLKARPNSNVLLVTNETTTPAFYRGKDKHCLVPNTLFRMGAAAIVLSNKRSWMRSNRAKYVLEHRVRVHLGAKEEAYQCIRYGPDAEGHNGTYLGLDVVKEAGRALTKAMVQIGPHVLTWKQMTLVAINYLQRRLDSKVDTYHPSFADGVQHFLIHAGGAKVLDGIGKSLRLEEPLLKPSRAVLSDYGNVSSSTTWYTLAYCESGPGVRRGDRVLQVGVGSGIKCGVNVWRALKDNFDVHQAWQHREGENRLSFNASQAGQHMRMRLLFLVLLVVLAAVAVKVFGLAAVITPAWVGGAAL